MNEWGRHTEDGSCYADLQVKINDSFVDSTLIPSRGE
jgi:hypothetical protein